MKKLLLALAATAAIAGSASAADMPGHAYTKVAGPVIAAPSWTGLYIFGGAGAGLWAADNDVVLQSTGLPVSARSERQGGSGWYGTVGAGFDWQINSGWVLGLLADGQFGNIQGTIADRAFVGDEKLRTSYAAGVRLGYLVAPNVLSYVNAGYSGSDWSGASTFSLVGAGGSISTTPSFHRNGFFVGGGVENNLNIFGISAPGWFLKTEYRSAFYNRVTLPESFATTGLPTADAITFKPWVQTISTSIVYRFNWSGAPMASKY
jgi:outer membrane immunogenic protein